MKMHKITKRLLKSRRKAKRSQDRKHEKLIRSLKGLIVALRTQLASVESDREHVQRLLDEERRCYHWLLIIEAEGLNQVFHFEGANAKALAMAAFNNNNMPHKVVTMAKMYEWSGSYHSAGKAILGMEIQGGIVSPVSRALGEFSRPLEEIGDSKPLKQIGNGST